MNEKSKNILIVVLMVIIGILIFSLSFILGMKYADKNSSEEIINKDESEKVITNIKVVDYINKSFNKNNIDKSILKNFIICGVPATEQELGTAEVTIPMIESEKIGAKSLNKMIQEKYKENIEVLNPNSYVYKQLEPSDDKKNSYIFGYNSVDYVYYNSDKYISIIIDSGIGSLCASGGGSKESYIYDIENDKYLTNEEVLKKFNITKEQLKNKFIEQDSSLENDSSLISSLNEEFNDLYYLYIKDGILIVSESTDRFDVEPLIVQIPIN